MYVSAMVDVYFTETAFKYPKLSYMNVKRRRHKSVTFHFMYRIPKFLHSVSTFLYIIYILPQAHLHRSDKAGILGSN